METRVHIDEKEIE